MRKACSTKLEGADEPSTCFTLAHFGGAFFDHSFFALRSDRGIDGVCTTPLTAEGVDGEIRTRYLCPTWWAGPRNSIDSNYLPSVPRRRLVSGDSAACDALRRLERHLLSSALRLLQCFALPGGVLSIGGGFFFGLWWGFLIVLVGNVGGAAISFLISRSIGRRWLHRQLLRNPRLKALEPAVRREGWKIILLSQLHPLFPTSLLNYLYGVTPIRFRTCMLWVAIGQAPGLFLYVYLGTLRSIGVESFPRQKSSPSF